MPQEARRAPEVLPPKHGVEKNNKTALPKVFALIQCGSTLHNDVKGVKMSRERVALEISGVNVHAHIKALPQVPESAN